MITLINEVTFKWSNFGNNKIGNKFGLDMVCEKLSSSDAFLNHVRMYKKYAKIPRLIRSII